MQKTTCIGLLFLGLGLAVDAPIQAEWILEASKTFQADRKGQMHRCCPVAVMILEEAETPALVCPFYVNNLKKKDKGRVGVETLVMGLESGGVLPEWRTHGSVQDNFWGECALLPRQGEFCLVELRFVLSGFPKLKKKRQHQDAFTAGVLVFPGAQAAGAGTSLWAESSLRDRLSSRLP